MKRLILIICTLHIYSIGISFSTPKVTSWSLPNTNLTEGKLDFSKGSPRISYSFSREIVGDSYEDVDIELVFYVLNNGTENTIPTIYITNSNFNGSDWMGSDYHYPTIPNIPGGYLRAKYRTKASGSATYGSFIYLSKSIQIHSSIISPPAPFNPQNAHLFMSNRSNNSLRKSDYISGGYLNFGGSDWANIQGIVGHNSYIYIVQAGNLHKFNTATEQYEILGSLGIWNNIDAITVSSNGFLYIVKNSYLYKVSPSNGSFTIIGGANWAMGVEAMTAHNGYLYAVENKHLYKINENTGSYVRLGTEEWGGTLAITNNNDGYLYIIQNGYLHKVNSADGSYQILGERDWFGTNKNAAAFYSNELYIIQNKRLHRVNLSNGSWTVLGNPEYEFNDNLISY